jgi:hypothetical protein
VFARLLSLLSKPFQPDPLVTLNPALARDLGLEPKRMRPGQLAILEMSRV